MRPAILLRIAGAVAAVQAIAHGAMLLAYVPHHGAAEAVVVMAMKSHYFNLGGIAPHSYWQLYIGYGFFAAINCMVEAVLFWQLSNLAEEHSLQIKPIAALFCIANVGYAVMVWKYFFVPPLVADLTIAVCLGLAIMAVQPGREVLQIRGPAASQWFGIDALSDSKTHRRQPK